MPFELLWTCFSTVCKKNAVGFKPESSVVFIFLPKCLLCFNSLILCTCIVVNGQLFSINYANQSQELNQKLKEAICDPVTTKAKRVQKQTHRKIFRRENLWSKEGPEERKQLLDTDHVQAHASLVCEANL